MTKMRVLKIKLTALMIFSAASCGTTGIDFNPDFFVPNREAQSLENELGYKVPYDSEEMNDYACLHKNKIKELAELLRRARIPKIYKDKILLEASKIE